ncbi:MAG: hypothetical protein V9E99_08920 [Microthrixaceae bacterium]
MTTPSSRGTHNTAAPAAAGGTPVATLPLTTVPSSPLAAEIEAAYVAAWEDIKVAAQLDNYETPQLADHIVEPMLEKFRGLLRGLDVDGEYLVRDEPDDSWYRIEALEQLGNGEVVATICAYVDDVTLRQDTGEIAGRQQVAAAVPRDLHPSGRDDGMDTQAEDRFGRRPRLRLRGASAVVSASSRRRSNSLAAPSAGADCYGWRRPG